MTVAVDRSRETQSLRQRDPADDSRELRVGRRVVEGSNPLGYQSTVSGETLAFSATAGELVVIVPAGTAPAPVAVN